MSQRTEKVDSLLVHEISAILSRDFDPPQDCLITVMHAQVTPDLKHAKVFISILPENKTGSALKALKAHTGEIQRMLNKKLTMKFVPKISWHIDLTNIKYAQIDEALKQG